MSLENKIEAAIALRAEDAGFCTANAAISKLSAAELAEVKQALGFEESGFCDAIWFLRTNNSASESTPN